MGKDFLFLVVRRKKSNDVSRSRSGVDVIVIVQNDIFRTVDLTQRDRRNGPQFIVQREGERNPARFPAAAEGPGKPAIHTPC